jgi:hypothetical protein
MTDINQLTNEKMKTKSNRKLIYCSQRLFRGFTYVKRLCAQNCETIYVSL